MVQKTGKLLAERFRAPVPGGRPEHPAGFTLLELVVVISIMVALAAVLIPMTDGIDDARKTRAIADCTTLGGALLRYMQDTRFPPTGQTGQQTYDYLASDLGSLPALSVSGSHTMGDLADFTRQDTWSNKRWRGPYAEVFPPDPWGRKYLAWVTNFRLKKQVWVVSAGPDGTVQTGPDATALQGDDVGISVE